MNIIEIKINIPIDEAVAKLSKEVFSSYFKINHESLVGKVTLKNVSFYRAVPMENNTFLPVKRAR